jgi:predicted ATPase
MSVVRIDCDRITDVALCHTVLAEALGIPGVYGRTMNASIDYMISLGELADGMTAWRRADP